MKSFRVVRIFIIVTYFYLFIDCSYELKTEQACTTDGQFKHISGYQKDKNDIEATECEAECDEHDWCKGYRIREDNTRFCRLLTDHRDTEVEGWTLYNANNWVEPDEWKPSVGTGIVYNCYVKKC